MEERRRIDRVGYQAKSVIVVCDTGESIFVETRNVSPLGIAFTMPESVWPPVYKRSDWPWMRSASPTLPDSYR